MLMCSLWRASADFVQSVSSDTGVSQWLIWGIVIIVIAGFSYLKYLAIENGLILPIALIVGIICLIGFICAACF